MTEPAEPRAQRRTGSAAATAPATPRAAARLAVTPLELRLYAVASLAAVYAVAWLLVWRSPGPASDAAPAPVEAEVAPPAVWLDELPPAQRPVLAVPAGWRLASRGERAGRAELPPVIRAPASRPLRLRTRSS
jgi:hypothetical protein